MEIAYRRMRQGEYDVIVGGVIIGRVSKAKYISWWRFEPVPKAGVTVQMASTLRELKADIQHALKVKGATS